MQMKKYLFFNSYEIELVQYALSLHKIKEMYRLAI